MRASSGGGQPFLSTDHNLGRKMLVGQKFSVSSTYLKKICLFLPHNPSAILFRTNFKLELNYKTGLLQPKVGIN